MLRATRATAPDRVTGARRRGRVSSPPVTSISSEGGTSNPLERSRSRQDRTGTTVMIAGTVFSALAAYLVQAIGGRAVGAEAFAPVSVMWTVLFLGFTIFLIPVEQLVIRRLTLGGGRTDALTSSWPVIVTVLTAATVLAIAFAFAANGSLLGGDTGYVPVAALMFPGHGLLVVGRGFLAGRRRFVAYGIAVGLDAMVKLVATIVVVLAGWGPVALAWALVVSPLVVLVVRPFRHDPSHASPPLEVEAGSDRRFMGGFLVATAASQTILAAGPLVVGALGATSAAISVFFVTTTLFRGPMSSSYNLIARILPFMTRHAALGDHSRLGRLARLLALGGMAGAALVGAVSAALGPWVVEALYGADFRPAALVTGLAAAAVILAMIGLVTTQILVGRGETGVMALVWLVAIAAAGIVVAVTRGDPQVRVASAFLAGEGVALIGLTVAATGRRSGPASR